MATVYWYRCRSCEVSYEGGNRRAARKNAKTHSRTRGHVVEFGNDSTEDLDVIEMKARRVKRPNAVINGKTGSVECLACGASEKLIMPASIEEFVKQGVVFGKAHEACK